MCVYGLEVKDATPPIQPIRKGQRSRTPLLRFSQSERGGKTDRHTDRQRPLHTVAQLYYR